MIKPHRNRARRPSSTSPSLGPPAQVLTLGQTQLEPRGLWSASPPLPPASLQAESPTQHSVGRSKTEGRSKNARKKLDRKGEEGGK